jgi:hypothetical protein
MAEFRIVLAVMSDITVRDFGHLTLIVWRTGQNIVCLKVWIYARLNKEMLSVSQILCMRSHMESVVASLEGTMVRGFRWAHESFREMCDRFGTHVAHISIRPTWTL